MSTFAVPTANKYTKFPSTALQPAAYVDFPFAMSNAAWSKTRCSVVGGQADPFGGTSAFSLVEDGSANTHFISETITGFSATLPARMVGYAKAGTRSWICLGDGSSTPGAYVNLATGAIGTVNNGTTKVYTTSVGNGWWKITVQGPAFANNSWAVFMASADNTPSYAGDGASNVLLCAPSVE